MARPKLEIDEKEIDEIIHLKLQDLNGVKSKLTYNNVWVFNKKIANNKQYVRENGSEYNLYGYQFWASSYKGVDYLGKRRIDEIKSQDSFILAGKQFTAKMQDLVVLFDKYGSNEKEMCILRDKILRIFEKDRKQIEYLEEELEAAEEKLKNATNRLEKFQNNFLEMFYASQSEYNSLPNVMRLAKSEDEVINQQLREMFINRLEDVERNDVKSLSEKRLQQRRQELEEQGF